MGLLRLSRRSHKWPACDTSAHRSDDAIMKSHAIRHGLVGLDASSSADGCAHAIRRQEGHSVAGRQNRRPGPAQRAADEKTSSPDRKQAPVVAADLLVIMPLKDFSCAICGSSGSFLVMDDVGALCLSCADLDHLVFLPAGNAAVSRRARTQSGLAAVVVRFSRSRGRYERQGILVEEAALQLAEEQCLADADARLRRRERDAERRSVKDLEFQGRMADQIRQLYPGCPTARAEAIARHAATRGSGRIGRSAAGRALEPDAVRLSVVASVRHEDTRYDELLMAGVPRQQARDRVRASIDSVLSRWQNG
jgi:hypothetical protein